MIASREGFRVAWISGDLPRYPVAFGLWKGDLTLKRAIVDRLEKLRQDGDIAKIIARYLGDAKAAHRSNSERVLAASTFHSPRTGPASMR